MKQPVGIILAGGRATRMGGVDKGLLKLGEKPLLDHVIDRIRPQVADLAINANGSPDRFSSYGLAVRTDSVSGFVGPLSGILAGMDWANEIGATHVVSAASDTPFFPCDLVPQLLLNGGTLGLAIAASPSGRQPTFGLWPTALRDDLRGALESGVRKVVQWTHKHGAGTAEFPDDRAFFNVNAPEDLRIAEQML